MKKVVRSEYIMGLLFLALIIGYGIYSKSDVTLIISIIVGGVFTSKGLTDLGKNKKEKDF
jgi:hypothetical protein